MNRIRLIRYGLPVLLLTVSLTTLTLVRDHSAPSLRLQSTPAPTAEPAPSATPEPQVSVDGRKVDLGSDGTATVTRPSGQTTVKSSDRTTTVTTTHETRPRSTTDVSSDGNVNISVQSTTNGGSSSSSTYVQSFGGGTSWSNSSSSATIHVSQ